MRVRRQDRRAGQQQQLHVFELHQIQRRLACHENQLPVFLQRDIGGAQQNVVGEAVCDAPHRAHRARDDDHRIARVRATGERRVHALEPMRLDALGQAQAVRQLLLDHHLRVGAEHDVRLVPGHPQAIEQALGINHPTGSGYGNKDSHFDAKHPPSRHVKYAAGQAVLSSQRAARRLTVAPPGDTKRRA